MVEIDFFSFNRFLKLKVALVYGAALLGGRFNQVDGLDLDSQVRYSASFSCLICTTFRKLELFGLVQ